MVTHAEFQSSTPQAPTLPCSMACADYWRSKGVTSSYRKHSTAQDWRQHAWAYISCSPQHCSGLVPACTLAL